MALETLHPSPPLLSQHQVPPNNPFSENVLAKHELTLAGESCPKGGSGKRPGGHTNFWKGLLES